MEAGRKGVTKAILQGDGPGPGLTWGLISLRQTWNQSEVYLGERHE